MASTTYSILEVINLRWQITSSSLSQFEAQQVLARKGGDLINPGAPMITMRTDDVALLIMAAEDARQKTGAEQGGVPDYRNPAVMPGAITEPSGNVKNQVSPDMPLLNPTPDQPTTSEAS